MTEAVAADFLPVLAAESPRRSFVVSVHDVAPGTRETSGKIITALRDAGVRTASLLVVPNYHRQGSATGDPAFVSWLRDLEARGYEIVIHGYFHQRPRRSNERITEKFVTRIYTRDEGEFFDLDYEEAFARITKARDEFKAARLSPLGFVAPAWLLSAEGERAARDAGMQYTTRIDSVLDLLTGEREPTRALVYSVQSGWRRIMSLGWNAALARSLEMRELARLSIHPPDFAEPKTGDRFSNSSNASSAPATRRPMAIGLGASGQIERRYEPVRPSHSFEVQCAFGRMAVPAIRFPG